MNDDERLTKLPDTRVRELLALARRLHARGWMPATAGNLSFLAQRDPLTLCITASSLPKGSLREEHILRVDGSARLLHESSWVPSAETLLHVAIVNVMSAGAVVHTHTVWNTLLSELHFPEGGIAIEGYELLKVLAGVRSHDHREWVPILENSQDMPALAKQLDGVLRANPDCHAVLLRKHGLYTWGASLEEAERHAEALEFLFEVVGRMARTRSPEEQDGTDQNP